MIEGWCHYRDVSKFGTVFLFSLWVLPFLLPSVQILAWKQETRSAEVLYNPCYGIISYSRASHLHHLPMCHHPSSMEPCSCKLHAVLSDRQVKKHLCRRRRTEKRVSRSSSLSLSLSLSLFPSFTHFSISCKFLESERTEAELLLLPLSLLSSVRLSQSVSSRCLSNSLGSDFHAEITRFAVE